MKIFFTFIGAAIFGAIVPMVTGHTINNSLYWIVDFPICLIGGALGGYLSARI